MQRDARGRQAAHSVEVVEQVARYVREGGLSSREIAMLIEPPLTARAVSELARRRRHEIQMNPVGRPSNDERARRARYVAAELARRVAERQ